MRFRRLLRQVRPHVIQTWLYHADLFGLLADALPGRSPPFLWNIRCADTGLAGRSPMAWRMLKTLARNAHRPAAVVVNSAAGQAYHEGIGYRPRRWALIANGFDTASLAPDASMRSEVRRELGLADQTVAIGLFARLHPIKDHATFLRAAALAETHRPDLAFVLVGRGLERDDPALARLLAATAKPRNLHLLGPRHDATRLMQGLDMACLTSHSEGFPNVIGEAMATGLPAVVSDAGDMAVMVGDTGRVVAAGDVEGFARAFCELAAITPDARKALGRAARQRIADNYDLNEV
ncbi:MAG: glycosyltransferase, partial [Alphaproteobacteria bacterium]